MPYALILNTASKASLAGGTFADTLVANTGDSLSVANYDSGGARIVEAWGIDSASVAEVQWLYTRPESTHDPNHGWRTQIPALRPGGAATVGAHNFLPGYLSIPVFKSDAATIQVSGTAADGVLVSWLTEYDDLPGAAASFTDLSTVHSLYKSTLGVNVLPVASGTVGASGATRAINTDDDRFHANTYYAIMGWTQQLICTTVMLTAPTWGQQKIGGPGGVLGLDSPAYFADLSMKYGRPLIPYFNANDKGNVLIQIADDVASTSPKIDFYMVELTGKPA